MSAKGSVSYRWARPGDVNAFFGLVLDNLAGLLLLFMLLTLRFGYPGEMILTSLVPGTALGVLVGDLAFFFMAFHLAKKTGNPNVTAMPLGLDTPSTFGMIFFVLGPSFLDGQQRGLSDAEAAIRTWHIGIWCLVLSGIFKIACSPFCGFIRKLVPRAGLLGSLAAIALVLISFMPTIDILAHPLAGLLALTIVLTTLIGRIPLPAKIPGTLGALIVAGTIYYLSCAIGLSGYHFPKFPNVTWLPTDWLNAWTFGWVAAFDDALPYLPIAFPFALMTIVGGIDCTESAAAAGDDYDTRQVIAIEGVATLIAGLSGGVIQTTPYIGHPAYKAMGGRAAYSLATALVVGSAGMIGYFSILNAYLPPAVVFPILVFVGLEITAQSFYATPRKHYAAVAMACVPALSFLAMAFPGQLFGDDAARAAGLNPGTLADPVLQEKLATMTMLSNGFILTSLLWAWALAAIIDRKVTTAAFVFVAAGALTLFGFIHSPLAENRLFLPIGPESWGSMVLDAIHRAKTIEFAFGYFACAGLLGLWTMCVPLATSGIACEIEDLTPDATHHKMAVFSSGSGATHGYISRILETEVMTGYEVALDYDQMDNDASNQSFIADLVSGGSVGPRVVDLGTGPAHVAIELCKQRSDVKLIALDASSDMLDFARRRVEMAGMVDRIQLMQADIKNLDSFQPAIAETVICKSVLHHLPDPAAAIAAAQRMVVPGGRIFIRDLVRPATVDEIDHLVEVYQSEGTELAQKSFRDSFFAALSLHEARQLVNSFGYPSKTVRMTSDRHWTFDSQLG